MATPHYRRSAEQDHLSLLTITFIVGAMCGACVVLGLQAIT